ncbi:uncharacterized protein LOC123984448 isoform X2 [Micropterus dolomieu]|uniref:uncharacterized protein LOC123984448 isoform X2 n=1 Tax=Micropterus dolomieu TaxID=147949 RepID=UPI001E8EA2C6|nr:uncharacterized protein LOC123984448 isoform X2 [Micropterus dolomieu]
MSWKQQPGRIPQISASHDSRTLSMMDLVQRKRWFSLGSLIQIQRQTRHTRAMRRHVTMCLMPSCPTLRSPAMKPPVFSLRPLRMPAVQTLFLAFKSWKSSALCWWRLALQRISCHLPLSRGTRSLKSGMQWRSMTSSLSSSTSCTEPTGATPSTEKRDDLVDAAVIQRVKMAIHNACHLHAAHNACPLIAAHNAFNLHAAHNAFNLHAAHNAG